MLVHQSPSHRWRTRLPSCQALPRRYLLWLTTLGSAPCASWCSTSACWQSFCLPFTGTLCECSIDGAIALASSFAEKTQSYLTRVSSYLVPNMIFRSLKSQRMIMQKSKRDESDIRQAQCLQRSAKSPLIHRLGHRKSYLLPIWAATGLIGQRLPTRQVPLLLPMMQITHCKQKVMQQIKK